MNSALSWSIKGIEPEAREAAKLAARRAGLTLGQWLNTKIKASAESEFHSEPRHVSRRTTGSAQDSLHERIDQLAARLDQLSRQQTETAVSRFMPAPAETHPIEAAFEHVFERIIRNEKHIEEAFSALIDRLDRLAARLPEQEPQSPGAESDAGPDRAAMQGSQDPEVTAFEDALRSVVDHIERSDQRNREALARLDQRIAGLATMQSRSGAANGDVLAKLESQLATLARRLDEVQERGPHAGFLETVEQRIGELAERLRVVESTSRQAAERAAEAVARASRSDSSDVEQRLHEIVAQVRRVTQTESQTDAMVEHLGSEITKLAHSIEQLRQQAASEQDVTVLRSMLDRLASQVADQRGGHDEAAVLELERRISELQQRLDEAFSDQQSQELGAIYEHIRGLEARLAVVQPAQGDREAVRGLEMQIDELVRRLAHVEQQAGNIQALEQAMARLQQTVESGRTVADDAVDHVGVQMSELSRRLAVAEQQYAALQTMEQSIAQLFDSVGQSQALAQQAAEHAVERMAQRLQPQAAGEDSAAALRALEQGLEGVRMSAEAADRRTQQTLTAVQETLQGVVRRLEALERQERRQQPQPADVDLSKLRLPPLGAPQWDAAYAERSGRQETAQPPAGPGFDQRVEEDVRELATAEAEVGSPQSRSEPTSAVTTRRDDFIAAARRAAQAAAQGARPQGRSTLGTLKADPRPQDDNADSDVSKKRRPLLLAGAVLLLIGAVSAYSMIGGKRADAILPPSEEPVAADLPTSETANDASTSSVDHEVSAKTDVADREEAAGAKESALQSNALPRSPVNPLAVKEPDRGAETAAEPPPPTGPLADIAPLTTGSIVKSASHEAVEPVTSFGTFTMSPTADVTTWPTIDGPARDDRASSGHASPAAEPVVARTSVATKSAAIPKLTDMPPIEVGSTALRLAAGNGDPVAQHIVATKFAEGDGVEQDLRQAATWYQKAAARGFAPSQYRLATLYEKGSGVPKDLAAARIWYERAAEKGNLKAMHNLAVLYADGDRGTPDFSKAALWFRNAAEHGLKDSQYNLAVLNERGLGVAQNLVEAYKWFSLAESQGDRDAATRRMSLEQRLPASDLVSAKLEVENWVAREAAPEANTVTPPSNGWAAPAPVEAALPEEPRTVLEVQQLLNSMGYAAGPADGIVGARTREAIRRFEEESGRTRTGRITPDLLQALRSRAS